MATNIDCKNLKIIRQKENNELVFQALISQNEVQVNHHCNYNELYRVLEEFNNTVSLQQLLYKCKVDYMYGKTLAERISKNATRQSTKDETYILEKCNEAVSRVGIQIENLSATAFRLTKDGRILSIKEYKNSEIKIRLSKIF